MEIKKHEYYQFVVKDAISGYSEYYIVANTHKEAYDTLLNFLNEFNLIKTILLIKYQGHKTQELIYKT